VRKDQAVGLRKGARTDSTEIIVCSGGKGGVGKSLLSANLALALAQFDKRVLLFDADVGFANDELLLGVSAVRTLKDYLKGKADLEDVLTPTKYGIWLLSGGMDVEDILAFSFESKHRLVSDFLRVVAKMDYVVVDTPAGFSEHLRGFFEAADHLFAVTTSESTSLMNTYTYLKYLVLNGFEPQYHLVVNMVRDLEEGKRTAERLKQVLQRFVGLELSGIYIIRYDSAVKKSVIAQRPFVADKIARQPYFTVMRAAASVVKTEYREKLSFFDRVKRLFGVG